METEPSAGSRLEPGACNTSSASSTSSKTLTVSTIWHFKPSPVFCHRSSTAGQAAQAPPLSQPSIRPPGSPPKHIVRPAGRWPGATDRSRSGRSPIATPGVSLGPRLSRSEGSEAHDLGGGRTPEGPWHHAIQGVPSDGEYQHGTQRPAPNDRRRRWLFDRQSRGSRRSRVRPSIQAQCEPARNPRHRLSQPRPERMPVADRHRSPYRHFRRC